MLKKKKREQVCFLEDNLRFQTRPRSEFEISDQTQSIKEVNTVRNKCTCQTGRQIDILE